MTTSGSWRMILMAIALAAGHSPGWADELEGAGVLGIDPSFGPLIGGRPPGIILRRVQHLTGDDVRMASTVPSITRTLDLGQGRRLARLDRFGRKAEFELGALLSSGDELILDLRHNIGGSLRRMLRVAGRFTGAVPGALRLVRSGEVELLAIPASPGRQWHGRVTVLVGSLTISSGEVLAALLRRYAGASVLGERTWGKDYALRVEVVNADWRALIPDARIEVPGEVLAGGLRPDGPIPAALAARLGTR